MAATTMKLHKHTFHAYTNTTVPLEMHNDNYSIEENNRFATPAIVVIVGPCFVVFHREILALLLAAPREFARSQFFAVFRFFAFLLFSVFPFSFWSISNQPGSNQPDARIYGKQSGIQTYGLQTGTRLRL